MPTSRIEELNQMHGSYSIADAAGSYKLIVDGRHVWVDFYAGDSARRTKRFKLR